MMDLFELTARLSDAFGVSGLDGALNVAAEALAPIGKVVRDAAGGLKCSFGSGEYKIMLDAHIDEIGMIVTGIDGDFVRVAACGGVDARMLAAQEVVVHGERSLFGVFCSIPPHVKNDNKDAAPKIDELAIDLGMTGDEIKRLVRPGDRVSFRQSAVRLLDGRMTGKSLDNRAGVAAVICAAEKIKAAGPDCTVIVSLSAQEELGLRGARTAAFADTPDEAIVVDVSFADVIGGVPSTVGKLGGGAMLGVSPVLSKKMTDRLRKIAEDRAIPCQFEVMGGATSTDADVISVTKSGVPCALLSVPLRNMHSPTEIIDLDDVKNTAELIAGYVLAGGVQNA
jgi:putative aminopeptidase FrvX